VVDPVVADYHQQGAVLVALAADPLIDQVLGDAPRRGRGHLGRRREQPVLAPDQAPSGPARGPWVDTTRAWPPARIRRRTGRLPPVPSGGPGCTWANCANRAGSPCAPATVCPGVRG
jgi:hypothetical protein